MRPVRPQKQFSISVNARSVLTDHEWLWLLHGAESLRVLVGRGEVAGTQQVLASAALSLGT